MQNILQLRFSRQGDGAALILFGWKPVIKTECRPVSFGTRANLHTILPPKIIWSLVLFLFHSFLQLTPCGPFDYYYSRFAYSGYKSRVAENVGRFYFARVIDVGNFRCLRTPESHWECELNARIMRAIFEMRLSGQPCRWKCAAGHLLTKNYYSNIPIIS